MKRFLSFMIFLVSVTSTNVFGQHRAYQNNSQPFVEHAEQDAAQTEERVYSVPFASKGNAVKLQVANNSTSMAKGLEIKVQNIPKWMTFNPSSFLIGDLEAEQSATASYTFHVDKEAPINEKVTLRFVTKSANGYSGEKEIAMSVEAPTDVKLNQNYPNPFNPSTTINYQLPARMEVKITVFNILGQQITTLVNETQEAGSQEIRWDASRYASGLYFYRIIADAPGTDKIIQHKKMMLIK
jgi:hypothetical protein